MLASTVSATGAVYPPQLFPNTREGLAGIPRNAEDFPLSQRKDVGLDTLGQENFRYLAQRL